ncbi:MAG: hypothetical protein R3302_05285 [Sulfurimonadaceae bacterium]|nr:hypothetical protein [Sulfurimonadaceae bacterium]
MEPNLHDMDDYNKPTKSEKVKWIVFAFGVAIAVYVVYVVVMESFTGS